MMQAGYENVDHQPNQVMDPCGPSIQVRFTNLFYPSIIEADIGMGLRPVYIAVPTNLFYWRTWPINRYIVKVSGDL